MSKRCLLVVILCMSTFCFSGHEGFLALVTCSMYVYIHVIIIMLFVWHSASFVCTNYASPSDVSNLFYKFLSWVPYVTMCETLQCIPKYKIVYISWEVHFHRSHDKSYAYECRFMYTQRRFDGVKRSKWANHVRPYFCIQVYGCTGFVAVPQLFCNESDLYVFFAVSNASSSTLHEQFSRLRFGRPYWPWTVGQAEEITMVVLPSCRLLVK